MRLQTFGWAAVVAVAVMTMGGRHADAQQASPQYGYATGQAAAPSGQYAGACHPGCHVEKWGCNVVYCPYPPPCHNIPPIPNPPIETPPACHTGHVIYDELPPTVAPYWVTVHRNHYVPIKIQTVPTPTNVRPVNILVKYREIHYLCDCPPGTTQCPHIPATPQAPPADAAPAPAPPAPPAASTLLTPGTPAPVTASTPAQVANPTVTPPPAPAPAATPVAATAGTPAKQWVYLTKQQVWGYGYQRADGYWVIDESSKRSTPPTVQSAMGTTVTLAAPSGT